MGKEYRLHVACLKHGKSAFPQAKFIHIANQARDAQEAFFNKQMGVEPGVSDFLVGWKPRNVGVLEIKTPDGNLSTPQNKFLSWAYSIGWSIGVAKSVRQFHNVLVQIRFRNQNGNKCKNPNSPSNVIDQNACSAMFF